MADTIQSRSNISDILKNVYFGEIQDAIQNEVSFLKSAQRKQMPLDGTDLVIATHLARNNGIGSRQISDYLPDGQAEGYKQGTLRATRTFGTFVIDNEIVKLSQRDVAAFDDAMSATMGNLKASLLKDLERQACGDGTGALATIATSGVSGTNITVDDTRWLDAGMVIDVWNGTSSVATGRTVTSITSDTVFVINSATSLADGYVFRRAGNATGTRTDLEMNGIFSITGTGSFMGIDPSVAGQDRWKGIRVDASNGGSTAPLSPALLNLIQVKARQKGNGKLDTCYTHPCQTAALVYGQAGIFPDVRWSVGDMNQVGKGADPVFGGIKVNTAVDFPKSKLVMFDSKDLIYGELNGVEMEKFGDHELLHYQDSTGVKAAVKGYLSWRGNLGCLRRNSFVELYNLSVPAGY